jgi:hypothetical protein
MRLGYAKFLAIAIFTFSLSPVIQNDTAMAATSYSFSNAGASGRNGPNQTQINSAYLGTSLEGLVTVNTQGIQEWVAPSSGKYQINIAGAAGGNGAAGNGGAGAFLSMEVNLTSGVRYAIVVGQKGGNYIGSSYPGGSGGGGSFIYELSTSTFIAAAGGGGGGASSSSSLFSTLANAGGKADTTAGTTINICGSFTSAGGTNGAGGLVSTRGAYHGGPGAGISSDGGSAGGLQGRSRINGWLGGNGSGTGMVPGGFGGGGAAGSESGSTYGWAGGGGGYSGGGGGGNGACADGQYGGGGGSYYTGLLKTATNAANSSDGYITITSIQPSVVGLSIAGSVKQVSTGERITLTATIDQSGKVTFQADGKKIAGCISINAAPGNITCNWKPTIKKTITISAILVQGGVITSRSANMQIIVVKRINTR